MVEDGLSFTTELSLFVRDSLLEAMLIPFEFFIDCFLVYVFMGPGANLFSRALT